MTDEPDLFDVVPAEGAPRPPRLAAQHGVSVPPPDVSNSSRAAAPPTMTIVPFPLAARIGKVRDVAAKLTATKSDKHAAFYRRQIDEALRVNMGCKRVPEHLWPGEIARFWQAVNLELARRQARPSHPAA